jgi:hypothetical protein
LIIISFTRFLNLVAYTCSQNIIFIVEKAVSDIPVCLSFLFVFHFNRSFVCNSITSLFLNLLFLVDESLEFFLTYIPGLILFSSRYLKFLFVSKDPSAKTDFILIVFFFLSYELMEKIYLSLTTTHHFIISSVVTKHISYRYLMSATA